jgi:hypothetical protein
VVALLLKPRLLEKLWQTTQLQSEQVAVLVQTTVAQMEQILHLLQLPQLVAVGVKVDSAEMDLRVVLVVVEVSLELVELERQTKDSLVVMELANTIMVAVVELELLVAVEHPQLVELAFPQT